MKLIVGNRDMSELVISLTWSGDEFDVSRKLEFELLKNRSDYYVSRLKSNVNEGEPVILEGNNGKDLFTGTIIDISFSENDSSMQCIAFDFMFYVKNSDISGVFDDTAEGITGKILSKLGIKAGNLISTGVRQYQAFLPQNAYKAIIKAYRYASGKTGKKYMPIMEGSTLSVVEKGRESGVIIDENYNLIDAEYKISLSKLVNKVLVADKKGKILDIVKDSASIKKYGTVQRVVKSDEDKTGKDEAKDMLTGAEKSISIKGISDIRAVAGKSIIYIDPSTKKKLRFYIKSDSHSFFGSYNEMSLNLVLTNEMDGGD